MSSATEDNSEGWRVKLTKSTAKKQQTNRIVVPQHNSPDVIKKIESYISKAKKLKDSEILLRDLQEVKSITLKVYKGIPRLEWTMK